jgi:hypothetical protein
MGFTISIADAVSASPTNQSSAANQSSQNQNLLPGVDIFSIFTWVAQGLQPGFQTTSPTRDQSSDPMLPGPAGVRGGSRKGLGNMDPEGFGTKLDVTPGLARRAGLPEDEYHKFMTWLEENHKKGDDNFRNNRKKEDRSGHIHIHSYAELRAAVQSFLNGDKFSAAPLSGGLLGLVAGSAEVAKATASVGASSSRPIEQALPAFGGLPINPLGNIGLPAGAPASAAATPTAVEPLFPTFVGEPILVP